VARANAVRHPRVFQRFALTEIAGLSLTEAPRTNDLHRWKCNVAIGVPSGRPGPMRSPCSLTGRAPRTPRKQKVPSRVCLPTEGVARGSLDRAPTESNTFRPGVAMKPRGGTCPECSQTISPEAATVSTIAYLRRRGRLRSTLLLNQPMPGRWCRTSHQLHRSGRL
jgi:hypothetical protein